jgi:hypothetical protein
MCRPVLDTKAALVVTGASDEATRKALNTLAAAGILVPVDPGRRHGRWWEATAIIGLQAGDKTIFRPCEQG